jgi:hypothetical protein
MLTSTLQGIVLIGVCACVMLSPVDAVDGCSCDACPYTATLPHLGGSWSQSAAYCPYSFLLGISVSVQATDQSTFTVDIIDCNNKKIASSPSPVPCFNYAWNSAPGELGYYGCGITVSVTNQNKIFAADIRYGFSSTCGTPTAGVRAHVKTEAHTRTHAAAHTHSHSITRVRAHTHAQTATQTHPPAHLYVPLFRCVCACVCVVRVRACVRVCVSVWA